MIQITMNDNYVLAFNDCITVRSIIGTETKYQVMQDFDYYFITDNFNDKHSLELVNIIINDNEIQLVSSSFSIVVYAMTDTIKIQWLDMNDKPCNEKYTIVNGKIELIN